MRTEHGKSYMESAPVAFNAEDTDNCGFCTRNPAPNVRDIAYSRNGYQGHRLVICAECAADLVLHLSAAPRTEDVIHYHAPHEACTEDCRNAY